MLILGIESSCDETAAAVVLDGRLVLSNVISSQISLHQKTGGVVPEIAARNHVLNILPVIEQAMKDALVNFEDLDAIAVTKEPGLIGCLLVGRNTAEVLANVYDKQLIYVNHIHGHVYANWLLEKGKGESIKYKGEEFEFPIVILSVSGGHNDIILMRNYGDFEVLGSTLDDAAGEAFDKVARMIGLSYPGGPSISKASENGDRNAFQFPRSMIKTNDFNFSFSGLKTSVLYKIKELSSLSSSLKCDIAASFQEAVCDVLVTKILKAAKKYDVKELHLTGGVSANKRLRELLLERNSEGRIVRFPTNISFCTDNAAMIAAAGFFHICANDLE